MNKWRWIALFFSGLWIVLMCGMPPVRAMPPSMAQLPQRAASATIAQTSAPPLALSESTTNSITAGIEAFETGRFADAIAHWETALSQATLSQTDGLTSAYLLSNLATARQQLGDISAAQTAIAESLTILENEQSRSQTYWEISARALNAQGQVLWRQGQAQQALSHWQQAEAHYRTAQSSSVAASGVTPSLAETEQSGLIRSQINQAIAQQELGFNQQAMRQLTQLTQQLSTFSPSLQVAAAKELGRALRRIGKFAEAESVLSMGLQLANTGSEASRGKNAAPVRQLELELGHTLRSLSHREIAIGATQAAQTSSRQALDHYAKVASSDRNSQTELRLQLQAQLNQLSHLVEIGQLLAAQALWPQIDPSVLSPGRDRIEAYISYAHSLLCLQAPAATGCVKQEWQAIANESAAPQNAQSPSPRAIAELLADAHRQARALSDPLLAAYAMGELGHLYELSNQPTEAIRLTQQALSILEGKRIPEVAYQWEWQLGRLYSREFAESSQAVTASKGTRSKAIAAYQQALTSLATVRQNLSQINPQVQFSFRDNVEPLYREFVVLLLNQPSGPGGQPSPEALSLAISTIDALQLTELENFLGCELTQLVNLNETSVDANAAKIYPIVLPQQLAIIVDLPDRPLLLRTVEVSQREVEAAIQSLRENLTLPGKTPAVLDLATQLYSWLISPLDPILAENEQIQTLVFVPDGPLRNIPMGVLYDGQQYLIEKDYAIAVAPQLELFTPRPTSQLKVLRGGVGLPQTVQGRSFPSIELVQAELEQIPEELTVDAPLLNEDFTKANIEKQLARQQYTAIHWKTHGIFSSDPIETFLVAYQDDITANELSDLIRAAREQQSEPLELLVLSACETALGDRRAVLGLAGIAVRAGTRSTLSTLWRADDGANTQLMSYFYQGLNDGLTKAQALKRSQQALLNEEGYPAPYYWAPYVLVGNWL